MSRRNGEGHPTAAVTVGDERSLLRQIHVEAGNSSISGTKIYSTPSLS